ncbi:MAG TPA: MBL fold metallo-hydrolase, partial [Edaphobacter sp.]|nr:MBL fold metallo-hydrolase [Edaphobacter sp.]
MRYPVLLAVVLPMFADTGLPSAVRFTPGPVNSVAIGTDTAVYAVPKSSARVGRLLLTHARRDAMGAAPKNAVVIVPAAERELFNDPGRFWNALENGRFHDYAQKGTKIPVLPLTSVQTVKDNDEIALESATVRVIATPGYTPGAVSYVIDADGKPVVCTGDLIYGDGKLFDLYSLQDAVPEAKARGYHGYAARAGELIASLRKIAALKPDVLLPARGPAIQDPQRSISLLIARLQTFLQSHFETDALRWYWGDENHRTRSRVVERPMNVMPMAEQSKLPQDIVAIGNSRVILSKTGASFLVDAGYSKILPELERMKSEGRIRSVDGIWITHYHDDHTDYVNDVVKTFGAPVYFANAMSEVIANPGGFRLPCLTKRPIPIQHAKADGESIRWNEWQFTFWRFPGQTLYHGGLVARRDDGQTYLFVGDSFTPSGMDDYCMQNRDFLREGEGYDYCLRRIATLPRDTWLLNQHVEPMFRYAPEQLTRMKSELEKRSAVLREMSPWPDINYAVDESWARMYPYGQEVKDGDTVNLSLRITNHAPASMTYAVKWNVPDGWKLIRGQHSVKIQPMKDGEVEARFLPSGAGLHIITADLSFGPWQLPEWTEALVRVRPEAAKTQLKASAGSRLSKMVGVSGPAHTVS